MKKYLVVGNPIDHSLSPKLHNYWMKNNNIDGIYDRKNVDEADLKQLILKIKIGELSGINVTVPHKKSIITYLDELSPEAKITQIGQHDFFISIIKLLVTIQILKVLKKVFKI